MTEHFQPQIDYAKQENKTDFKLFYIIKVDNSLPNITLEMKSLSPNELDTFDFSNLEFIDKNSLVHDGTYPIFKYKNT